MSSPLDAASIAALCNCAVRIEVVAQTGSTNADLLARLPELDRPTALIALDQTAGRGRAGRSWLSQAGSALTFSLAWKFMGPLARLAGLPLAVGVVLAESLAALDVHAQLKWPNDLLKDGHKLAGILTETQGAADGGVWAVIGIGLNLVMPDELEARIGHAVASAPWLAQMDRNALMAALLEHLDMRLREFDRCGFAPFCARWNGLHAYQGRAVRIVDAGTLLHEGVAAGVDVHGCLLLDTDAGRIEIVSGDVSLRVKGK
jgi:BirA family transcriptional regulator, biotin operon repressor / biotin---[acetyl-CoA-carboxylase] ligase